MRLLFMLLGNVCIPAMVAYLVGRNKRFRQYILAPLTFRSALVFTAVCSFLAIISSYYGIRIYGALASTRIVGVLMGGIIGGPWVGLATGIIGGLHRYSLGGFTALSCGIATFLAGIMAGLVRSRYSFASLNWKVAAGIALAAEVLQKSLTLILAKPFEQALAFERTAALPTTAVTVVGTVLFVLILQDMQKQYETAGADAAQISMHIANETMPYLRKGLDRESAQKAADIILSVANVDAVAITNGEECLAYAGLPSPYHAPGVKIHFPETKKVLETGQISVFAGDHGCGDPHCPLYYGIVVPLMVHHKPAGVVRFYQTRKKGLSQVDVEMAEGVARLLSTQIELADYEEQRLLREQAEFKALQSQINPHFLFNTLSIIMSLVRTRPETARELLINLSDMLHFTFAHHEPRIRLEEELRNVEAYLNIVQVRFGDRLTTEIDIPPDRSLLDELVPAFMLQPLVENAVTHGLFEKAEDCQLYLSIARENDRLRFVIRDNGVGMSAEQLQKLENMESKGIGTANVMQRIAKIYQGKGTITFQSKEGNGTTVTISLPASREV
jgi:LytS/YehU family sensor histidine kinase